MSDRAMKKNKLVVRITKAYRTEQRLVAFVYIFLAFVILISFLCSVFSVSEIIGIKTTILNINNKIDRIETSFSEGKELLEEDTTISYYQELSEKTDAAIDRILTIVGLLAAVVSFFGLLLTFRAPQNITNQINQVREVGEKAIISAEDAQYQLDIFVAVNFDSNNNPSNVSRINKLTKIINQHPEKPDAYIMRARIYEQLNQQLESLNDKPVKEYYRLAICDYSVAMALGADIGSCNNNIGVVYMELEDPDEALKYYNEAIKANAEDNTFYINRGNCYEELGYYQASLDDFAKAIELDGKDSSAYFGRSYTYLSLRENEKDRNNIEKYINLEKEDLLKTLEIDPSYKPANDQLKNLEKEMKRLGIKK